jgi:hypothetical protein
VNPTASLAAGEMPRAVMEMPDKPFILTVTVWGRDYTEKFIRFALPTFLSSGNIPELVQKRKAEFLIITSAVSKIIISEAAIFNTLSFFIKITFIVLDFDGMSMLSDQKISTGTPPRGNAVNRETSMTLMSLGHRTACDYTAACNGYCIFLGPDFLLSDGSLAYLDRRAAAGVRAILLPGFRLIEEEAREVLVKYYIDTASHAITIPSRRLVRLIFNHVHPEMKSYMVDSGSFSYCPNYVVWPLPAQATLLVHAFHLHPLLVDVSRSQSFSSLTRDTIDGDFVGYVIDDWDAIEIVRDSDDATVVSLTPKLAGPGVAGGAKPDPDVVSRWAYSSVITPLHRHCFSKIILLHAGSKPLDSDLPLAETGRFVYESLRRPGADDPATLRSMVRALRSMAKRHARDVLRRKMIALRFAAAAPLRMLRHGVRVGRLLERLDVEIGGLVAENRALHERLAASTRGDSPTDFGKLGSEMSRPEKMP